VEMEEDVEEELGDVENDVEYVVENDAKDEK
jgi:hypothetical protein